MKITATTFIASAIAGVATTFLPVAAECGMQNFQIKASTDQNKQETEKTEETEGNTSRRDLRQKGGKSSKEPDHNECDIETVQRAQMCADYTFKIVNTDGDDELGQEDWDGFATRASSGGATDRQIKAANRICGWRFDHLDLGEIAAFASTNNATMKQLEWETEMVLVFCENDFEGLIEAKVLEFVLGGFLCSWCCP